MSEKGNAFLRPLKKKGFKEVTVTSMRLNNLSTSTTLESNKSLMIPTTLLKKYLVQAPFPVREIGPVLTLLHACHIP